MSRPEKEIDWKKVDNLLMAGCHGTEIAPHFDMHAETFYDRVKKQYNIGFTEYSSLKRQQGDSILRAKQYEKAMSLDNTMLIWLGKQRLKQRENLDDKEVPLDNNMNFAKLYIESEAKRMEMEERLNAFESKANNGLS